VRANKRLTWLMVVLGTLVLTEVALGQASTNFDLSWHLLSGGGGSRSSAGYRIDDSLGQWIGQSASSTSYRIEPGFWYGTVVSEEGRKIYLPLVVRNDSMR
jgi:hypothetical protein